MASEAWVYSRSAVEGANGQVDTALFRVSRRNGGEAQFRGTGQSNYGRRMSEATRRATGTSTGVRGTGRIRRTEMNAGARGASRNPASRSNRQRANRRRGRANRYGI